MAKAVRLFHPITSCFLLILSCLVFLGGCGAKQGNMRDSSDAYWLLPDDDGASPLTSTELAVLEDKGEIDRDLPPHVRKAVARQYKYFLRQGRRTMSVFSRRAEPYLAYARQVFRSCGMPEELAYLAIVESGYKAEAFSHAGAAGAWQFMKGTGEAYGLKQDWWLDERLDTYAATEAAATYLKKLYGDFKDWPTAIAAYNAGEGKMRRAMRGSNSRNFFETVSRNHLLDEKKRLRDETCQYVPRFLAVTKIMRNLGRLGFEPIAPEAAPRIVRLSVRPGTDLRAMAMACGLSQQQFDSHNPHHKQVITCTARTTNIYLPEQMSKRGMAYLSSPQAGSYAGWHAATVTTSSDSWEKISRRAKVPVKTLMAVNPDRPKLKVGHVVLVPRSVNMSAKAVADVALQQRGRPKAGKNTYRVQKRDSLWNIARKYNVSVEDLKRWNRIDEKSLRPGATLIVGMK